MQFSSSSSWLPFQVSGKAHVLHQHCRFFPSGNVGLETSLVPVPSSVCLVASGPNSHHFRESWFTPLVSSRWSVVLLPCSRYTGGQSNNHHKWPISDNLSVEEIERLSVGMMPRTLCERTASFMTACPAGWYCESTGVWVWKRRVGLVLVVVGGSAAGVQCQCF